MRRTPTLSALKIINHLSLLLLHTTSNLFSIAVFVIKVSIDIVLGFIVSSVVLMSVKNAVNNLKNSISILPHANKYITPKIDLPQRT